MKKIAIIILNIVFALCVVGCSCKISKYKAEILNCKNEIFNEDFLNNNRVKGYYPNPDYIEGEYNTNKNIKDNDSPKSRTFVIDTESKYNDIFTTKPFDIDFNKQMIILYIFSSDTTTNYILKNIEIKDKILKIKIKLENTNVDAGCILHQRCIVIKMNKVEINSVEFN